MSYCVPQLEYRHRYPHRIPYCFIDESTTLERKQNFRMLNLQELTEHESNVLALMKNFHVLTLDQIFCFLYMKEAFLFNDELIAVLVNLVQRGALEVYHIISGNKTVVCFTSTIALQRFLGEQQQPIYASLQEVADHLEGVSLFTELINSPTNQIAYAAFEGKHTEIVFRSGRRVCYVPCQRSVMGWEQSLLKKKEVLEMLLNRRSNMTFVLGCESAEHMTEMEQLVGAKLKKPFYLTRQSMLNGSLALMRMSKGKPSASIYSFPME